MKILKIFTHRKQLLNLIAAAVVSIFSANVIAGETSSVNMTPMQGGDPPPDARDPFANSGGYEYRGMAGWEETDEIAIGKIIVDQLEYRSGDKENLQRWDMQGWYGTDYDKLWLKFEGDIPVGKSEGELELQTLYSRAVSAYWDMQFGARFDRIYGGGSSDSRLLGVFGFQGLAPYWFDVEPAVFIDDDGNLSARLTATYDLLFTQRLILQPRTEFNLSANDVPKFGVGKGLNDLQLGLRLRYEFTREIAPYVGVAWQKQYADTANFTSADGGIVEDAKILAGIRLWF
ncbi:MAG: copper resistance protein B [Gammaproteobacteria bacterium]